MFQESVHQYLDLGTLQQVVGVVTFSTELNRERERERTTEREKEGRKELKEMRKFMSIARLHFLVLSSYL